MKRVESRILVAILGLMAFLATACAPAPAPAADRTRFTSPEEAAKALLHGLRTNSAEELKAIFGPAVDDISSGDPVSDRNDRHAMAVAMETSWKWEKTGGRMELIIGDEKWPFPAPLTEVSGGWQFDTAAGREEVLSRRIGRNELRVIGISRDYVSMQKAYASQPRDGKLGGLYAQKVLSSPGRQDGLYWRVGDEASQSPLGDLVAQAVVEGYDINQGASEPLWGYHFRILTAQGSNARGGATSYIVNGEMSGGFALIASPSAYGRSGIMTFVVNQDGVVYQKDLGTDTGKLAAALTAYDPDTAWTAVKSPER